MGLTLDKMGFPYRKRAGWKNFLLLLRSWRQTLSSLRAVVVSVLFIFIFLALTKVSIIYEMNKCVLYSVI